MNPQCAARTILNDYLQDVLYIRDSAGKTKEHAAWLLEGIASGYVQHEKAHRWLGYAQALLVIDKIASLDDMKAINRGAK